MRVASNSASRASTRRAFATRAPASANSSPTSCAVAFTDSTFPTVLSALSSASNCGAGTRSSSVALRCSSRPLRIAVLATKPPYCVAACRIVGSASSSRRTSTDASPWRINIAPSAGGAWANCTESGIDDCAGSDAARSEFVPTFACSAMELASATPPALEPMASDATGVLAALCMPRDDDAVARPRMSADVPESAALRWSLRPQATGVTARQRTNERTVCFRMAAPGR